MVLQAGSTASQKASTRAVIFMPLRGYKKVLSIPDFKVTELMHKNYAPFVRTADKCITAFLRFLTAKTKSMATGFKEKIIHLRRKGELPEWSIGTVSKTVVSFRIPRVQIPDSPP